MKEGYGWVHTAIEPPCEEPPCEDVAAAYKEVTTQEGEKERHQSPNMSPKRLPEGPALTPSINDMVFADIWREVKCRKVNDMEQEHASVVQAQHHDLTQKQMKIDEQQKQMDKQKKQIEEQQRQIKELGIYNRKLQNQVNALQALQS